MISKSWFLLLSRPSVVWVLQLLIAFMCSAIVSVPCRAAATTRPSHPKLIATLENGGDRFVRFSDDDALILTATETTVHVWDARTHQRIGEGLVHGDGLSKAQFDHAGDRVLTISTETDERARTIAGAAKVWEVRTGKLICTLHHGDKPLSDAVISPDGRRVVTCLESDPEVKIWDANTGKLIKVLSHQKPVQSVAFDHAGKLLICGGQIATLWRTDTWKVRQTFDRTDAWGPPAPSLTRDSKRIAISTLAGFSVYDLATNKLIAKRDFLHLDESISWFCISPKGRYVATAATMGGAVWDATTGDKLLEVKDGYGRPVFSPDETMVLFDYAEPFLFDVRTHAAVRLEGNLNPGAACFSHDGKLLAIGNYDNCTAVFSIAK